jgi:hypothetical protein
MSQSIIYKSLFEVNIRHHFFLNKGQQEWDSMSQEEKDTQEAKFDVKEILDISPTPDCVKLLNAHNCIFKKTATGILIGIKAEPDEVNVGKFKPYISLNDEETFRFSVQLKDYNFLNYTALSLQSARNRTHILTNSAINDSNLFPALTSIPPVFESGKTYMPGDMLSDSATNQTKLFTALVKTTDNPTGSSDWLTENLGPNIPVSYINVNDSYAAANGIFTYTMKEKDALPIAQINDASGNSINPKIEILQGDFRILQIDMTKFKEGIYSVHVESSNTVYSDDVTFYLLQSSNTPFALVEIKVKSKQTDYDLIVEGDLTSPVFEIRFRNRQTHWRYVGKKFTTPFITDTPLPLTRYGNIEIFKPPDQENSEAVLLPNPSTSLIKAEALKSTNETKYFSEIHIN